MSYSSNDFSEDIVRCLVHAEIVEAAAISDADIGKQVTASKVAGMQLIKQITARADK